MNDDKKIAVIGLGYVGLSVAVAFGKHFNTYGFDLNKTRISELEKGIDNNLELTKQQILNSKMLKFTSSLEDIKHFDFYIISVPTPVDCNKIPDLTLLKKASYQIGKVLKNGSIVIYESTVFPGATEEICVPILENESKLKFNKNFFCGYSPERVNPGDKTNDLPNVKKITSGSDYKTAEVVDNLYKVIIKAGTFKAKSIKIAEAAKVIENSQRDLNIAFVNELSLIFNKMNIDTSAVLEAAGSKWNFQLFKPGMVGGHCIGVDPYYLTYKAKELGYDPDVILAGRKINDNMATYAGQEIIKKLLNMKVNILKSKIAIFGITFKENCPDIRNTKVIDLINELLSWGTKVDVFDPWAEPKAVRKELGINLKKNLNLSSYDAVVVAVGHKQFRDISPKYYLKFFKNKNKLFIADLKSLYSKEMCEGLGYNIYRL